MQSFLVVDVLFYGEFYIKFRSCLYLPGLPVKTKISKYEIGKNAKMIFEISKNAKMIFESWQKRIKVKKRSLFQ